VELAAAIRERRTTCVAAMEAVLERARAIQPRLNCFLRLDEDAALMLEVIAPGFAADLAKPIAGLRIGRAFREDCDSEIAAAMEASLDVFRRLGATVVDVELPDFRG